jgi:hypothetical protein
MEKFAAPPDGLSLPPLFARLGQPTSLCPPHRYPPLAMLASAWTNVPVQKPPPWPYPLPVKPPLLPHFSPLSLPNCAAPPAVFHPKHPLEPPMPSCSSGQHRHHPDPPWALQWRHDALGPFFPLSSPRHYTGSATPFSLPPSTPSGCRCLESLASKIKVTLFVSMA